MAQVNDIVKAFDFPHTDDHYIVARVTKVTEDGMLIGTVLKQVAGGVEKTGNGVLYTPDLGNDPMDEVFSGPQYRDRVQVLG